MRRSTAPSQQGDHDQPSLGVKRNHRLFLTSSENFDRITETKERHRDGERYFTCVWGKNSNRKHKVWEGDGHMIVNGRAVTIVNSIDGKEVLKMCGLKLSELDQLTDGFRIPCGDKLVEILSEIASPPMHNVADVGESSVSKDEEHARSSIIPKSFKKIKLSSDVLSLSTPEFVLPLPPTQCLVEGVTPVPVVVERRLARHLRPHQQSGVTFLYQCSMGYLGPSSGAILADAMGLGKTLQVITLIWTLLKQNPVNRQPVVRKVLIVTPGSLVNNWKAEFSKWLPGTWPLPVFAAGSRDGSVKDYLRRSVPVLIISYELFTRQWRQLPMDRFDLLVCDEAHRLKTNTSQIYAALYNIPTKRRVLLTGTPFQNDLEEFFSLMDFANPGILGCFANFRVAYMIDIVAGRQPDASPDMIAEGEHKSQQLASLTDWFILRRDSTVNAAYLPPKREYVVFCLPTQLQIDLFNTVADSYMTRNILSNLGGTTPAAEHLRLISWLRKISNEPSLLYNKLLVDLDDSFNRKLLEVYSSDYNPFSFDDMYSGKLWVCAQLMAHLISHGESLVLASNSTKTLDVLEKLCASVCVPTLRLDGSTATAARQNLVIKFNSPGNVASVFLLSSKAGGTGLNLIGASHLVLFDADWNPAHDAQVMSRVWRDGQKKLTRVYRLLTTGSIDERIFHRQIVKTGMSNHVVERSKQRGITFSKDELRDIFTFVDKTTSITHDSMKCPCLDEDIVVDSITELLPQKKISDLDTWTHVPSRLLCDEMDAALCSAADNISLVMWHQVSNPDVVDD